MKTFMIMDEKSMGYEANLITIIEIENNEYAIYSVDKNDNTSNVYVSLITKDSKENDILQSIKGEDKEKVFQIVMKMLDIN